MENAQTYLALAHQLLPADLWNKFIVFLGYVGLITQLVPALVAWGVPAATRFADWIVDLALRSPLRPLVLWRAPAIVAFLKSFKGALDQILDTFDNRVEADLEKAETPPPPAEKAVPAAQPQSAPAAQPEAQGAPKSGA